MNCVYVHINNDFSGSSYAISAIIASHKLKNYYLATNFNNNGFIKESEHINRINIPYRFKGVGLKTIFQIVRYNLIFFFKFFLICLNNEVNVVYVNTIHPFMAALMGKIFKKKIVYHIHEYYIKPSLLIKFYLYVMKLSCSELIFVSEFTKKQYLKSYPILKNFNHSVQYTPVRFSTINSKEIDYNLKFHGPISMICAPKKYKGIYMLFKLALAMPERSFILLLNTRYDFETEIPTNLKVIVQHEDIESVLRISSICVNLSQKDLVLETFGLTLWESLTQGTPIICPNAGGPVEIVNDKCGIACETQNINEIIIAVKKILKNKKVYKNYSMSAIERSKFLSKKNIITNFNL